MRTGANDEVDIRGVVSEDEGIRRDSRLYQPAMWAVRLMNFSASAFK